MSDIVWFSSRRYSEKNISSKKVFYVIKPDNQLVEHRKNGPAWSFKTSKQWLRNNKFNRIDGPATIDLHGTSLFYNENIKCKEENYWNI